MFMDENKEKPNEMDWTCRKNGRLLEVSRRFSKENLKAGEAPGGP
jgi:hypothetical protein